jgi:ribonuclease-3
MAVDGQNRQDLPASVRAGSDPEIEALERRLDHRFAARDLLLTALTHASATGGFTSPVPTNYQRLEFLGDRVLSLAVADMLLRAYPRADEGELHRRHVALVRKETCALVARSIDLGSAIRLGGGEARAGGRGNDSILGDVCEAVIGALYIDAGYEAARTFIDLHWRPLMASHRAGSTNAKSVLQEWAQGKGLPTPTYTIVGRRGPDHAPLFVVEVAVEKLPPERGEGHSRREAEQEAAAAALRSAGVWRSDENAD